MRELVISYIQQHRFFSDRFLNSSSDQMLLALYVSTLAEVEASVGLVSVKP
jgi:hypothetical protein